MREGLLDKTNTARSAWADTAYSSAANEAFMGKHGFISRVHCKRPKGRTMPESMRRASNKKSKVRSKVEDVFAEQKNPHGSIRPNHRHRTCYDEEWAGKHFL